LNHDFSERYPNIRSKTSKSIKENEEPKDGKGGKDTQDGKGKDHESSLPPVFFWTMLRATLQLWQSLNCASNVIVRQRDQKERSVIQRGAHRNGRCPLEGWQEHPMSLANEPKEGCLERGRAAMAAFPNE